MTHVLLAVVCVLCLAFAFVLAAQVEFARQLEEIRRVANIGSQALFLEVQHTEKPLSPELLPTPSALDQGRSHLFFVSSSCYTCEGIASLLLGALPPSVWLVVTQRIVVRRRGRFKRSSTRRVIASCVTAGRLRRRSACTQLRHLSSSRIGFRRRDTYFRLPSSSAISCRPLVRGRTSVNSHWPNERRASIVSEISTWLLVSIAVLGGIAQLSSL